MEESAAAPLLALPLALRAALLLALLLALSLPAGARVAAPPPGARLRAQPPARVAILVTGQRDRWVEDAERALLEHGIVPLLAQHGAVDVHLCLDSPLAAAAMARLAAWPARLARARARVGRGGL